MGHFYARQIETWSTICRSQAAAVDVETGDPVGQLPHFDELMRFFRDDRLQPRDRSTLVHGDYKIDNLIFHRSEPRVIGILEYVLSFSLLSTLPKWCVLVTSSHGTAELTHT